MRLVVAVGLVSVAIAIAALDSYISLHTGLNPIIAFAAFFFWLVVCGFCLRLALAENSWKMLVLPSALLLLTCLVFAYRLQQQRQQYAEKNGSPRRYYKLD